MDIFAEFICLIKELLGFINNNLKLLGFLLTIIAVAIYYKALRSSIDQNKISVSTSMMQHYSNEIKNIIDYGNRNEIQYGFGTNAEFFNVFNFHYKMISALDNLSSNDEFQKEIEKKYPFVGKNHKSIKMSDYYFDMDYMNNLDDLNCQLMKFIIRSFDLLSNIHMSNIILEEHKEMLKLEVFNNLLKPIDDKSKYEGKGYHMQYGKLDDMKNAIVTDFSHCSFILIFMDFMHILIESPELLKRLKAGNFYFEYLNKR